MYWKLKRIFDVVVSLGLIVLCSPALIGAAIGIKLSSPGPVFFRQVRVGRGGREFRPYKFRSMRAERTPDPKEIVPLNHPDITALGLLLRRLKIDELPQLFNVLNGDMSLVGPRPTLPDQVAAYDDFQRQRLEVRPGLTGLAQVNGNAAIPWDERIKYDVYYVRHGGFALELMIYLKTIGVVLLGEQRYARPFDRSPFAERCPS